MIETGKEATKALKEIKKQTRWSIRKISERLDINNTTVWSIFRGHVDNPSQEFMDAIEALRNEVVKP